MTGPEYTTDQPFFPWLPTYTQVIHDHPDMGWNGLEIDATKFPQITARKAELATRFFERYATRMVNQETLEKWQLRLQNRFDEVAPEFERAFRLYEANKAKMDSDVQYGSEQNGSRSTDDLVSETTKNTVANRNIDTPDKAINHDKNYADRVSDTEGNNTYAHTGSAKGSHTLSIKVNGRLVESINKSIYDYRDIDTEFVKSFENNFLNIFWS